MRLVLSSAVLATLAACATPPAQPGPVSAVASGTAPSRGVQLLAAAGRDNAPTRAEIERIFGRPDVARQDGAGAALTYRLRNCALLLLFVADQRNALKLSEAHASSRRPGGAAPSLEQCATEASGR